MYTESSLNKIMISQKANALSWYVSVDYKECAVTYVAAKSLGLNIYGGFLCILNKARNAHKVSC